MPVSYKKLWKLLIDRDMSCAELRRQSGINAYVLTKMRKNEDISMAQLLKICKCLSVDYSDIIEYVDE